jgi:hypothetical protein
MRFYVVKIQVHCSCYNGLDFFVQGNEPLIYVIAGVLEILNDEHAVGVDIE